MNWYKVAEEAAVSVTPERFRAITREERIFLARNERITQETQFLFFTEKYGGLEKDEAIYGALASLARNRNITPATQRLFFTEKYKERSGVLWYLARNESIAPEIQRLFFTEPHEVGYAVLCNLAGNPSITLETQRLFFTEQYENKYWVLWNLAGNWKFLRNFTTAQWLQIKNAARGVMRLQVLKKRLEQVIGAP